MPAPGIYVVGVVAVVAGVAAGIAFKEFVYDPHLAPKIEHWTDQFAAYRIARRRRLVVPHSYSQLPSDAEGDQSLTTKSSIELESLVEQEMHTLRSETSLRQRKPHVTEENGLEMLEKPNAFIQFAPLSPSTLLPPSKISASREDVPIPIGRFPASQADQRYLPPASASAGSLSPDLQSQTQPNPPNPAVLSLGLPGHPAFHITPSMSEYEDAVAAPVISPFTSASVSRAGTPWTNARSESFTDFRSGASSPDRLSETSFASDTEDSYPNLDASLQHVTVTEFSQASLNNQSVLSLDEQLETSLDSSISSSADARSDASLDFLESDGDHEAELIDMRSPRNALGILSDEEWESLSEGGRSAHQ